MELNFILDQEAADRLYRLKEVMGRSMGSAVTDMSMNEFAAYILKTGTIEMCSLYDVPLYTRQAEYQYEADF